MGEGWMDRERERWAEKRDTDGRRITIRYVGDIGDAHKPSKPRQIVLLRLLILFSVYIYIHYI
jgi:hypothetical protein